MLAHSLWSREGSWKEQIELRQEECAVAGYTVCSQKHTEITAGSQLPSFSYLNTRSQPGGS